MTARRPKIGLGTQIDALKFALEEFRGRAAGHGKGSAEIAYMIQGLEATMRTLRWVQENEAVIKAVADDKRRERNV